MSNKIAAPGKIFVCMACGKTSRDRYGDQKISSGWDESCMLKSLELEEKRLVYDRSSGLVIKVLDPEEVADGQPRTEQALRLGQGETVQDPEGIRGDADKNSPNDSSG